MAGDVFLAYTPMWPDSGSSGTSLTGTASLIAPGVYYWQARDVACSGSAACVAELTPVRRITVTDPLVHPPV